VFHAELSYDTGGEFQSEPAEPLTFFDEGEGLQANLLHNYTPVHQVWGLATDQEEELVGPGEVLEILTFELRRLDAARILGSDQLRVVFQDLHCEGWLPETPVEIVDGLAWIWFQMRDGSMSGETELFENTHWVQDDADDLITFAMDPDVDPALLPVVPAEVSGDVESADEIDAVYIRFKATPEPTTLAFFGVGLLALVLGRPRH
jgi:hypothetical protein